MGEMSVEKILVAAVVVGVVFYLVKMKDKSANAKPKISNEKPVVASNLWELKEDNRYQKKQQKNQRKKR